MKTTNKTKGNKELRKEIERLLPNNEITAYTELPKIIRIIIKFAPNEMFYLPVRMAGLVYSFEVNTRGGIIGLYLDRERVYELIEVENGDN